MLIFNHFLQLVLDLSASSESLSDIIFVLLSDLFSDSLDKFVFDSGHDLEERSLGPLECQLPSHFNSVLLDILLEHFIVEFGGRFLGHIVR